MCTWKKINRLTLQFIIGHIELNQLPVIYSIYDNVLNALSFEVIFLERKKVNKETTRGRVYCVPREHVLIVTLRIWITFFESVQRIWSIPVWNKIFGWPFFISRRFTMCTSIKHQVTICMKDDFTEGDLYLYLAITVKLCSVFENISRLSCYYFFNHII